MGVFEIPLEQEAIAASMAVTLRAGRMRSPTESAIGRFRRAEKSRIQE
jgi:hypothetical protein